MAPTAAQDYKTQDLQYLEPEDFKARELEPLLPQDLKRASSAPSPQPNCVGDKHWHVPHVHIPHLRFRIRQRAAERNDLIASQSHPQPTPDKLKQTSKKVYREVRSALRLFMNRGSTMVYGFGVGF